MIKIQLEIIDKIDCRDLVKLVISGTKLDKAQVLKEILKECQTQLYRIHKEDHEKKLELEF